MKRRDMQTCVLFQLRKVTSLFTKSTTQINFKANDIGFNEMDRNEAKRKAKLLNVS